MRKYLLLAFLPCAVFAQGLEGIESTMKKLNEKMPLLEASVGDYASVAVIAEDMFADTDGFQRGILDARKLLKESGKRKLAQRLTRVCTPIRSELLLFQYATPELFGPDELTAAMKSLKTHLQKCTHVLDKV